MDLYIGNATRQVQQFCYRVPEQGGVRVQDIAIGTQIKISGDLNSAQIDSIIDQHRVYGLIPAKEAGKVKDFAGLCYSVGKPIKAERLQLAMDANQVVLKARGEQLRRDAAISVNNAIEGQLDEMGTGTRLREVEMSAAEEEPRGGYRETPFGEGVRVTRDDAKTAARRRRSRGKQ